MVFVPGFSDATPSYQEIDLLEYMNNKILDLGGTIDRSEEDNDQSDSGSFYQN